MFKRFLILCMVIIVGTATKGLAQCSICAKTAGQLGKESALGLNYGIIYLMIIPISIIAYLGLRWWRNEKKVMKDES